MTNGSSEAAPHSPGERETPVFMSSGILPELT